MTKLINSNERDEFIYTKLFNNFELYRQIEIDFTMGSIDEWRETCDKFNNGEMLLEFAKIYMFNGFLYCNNMHPFSQNNDYETMLTAFNTLYASGK